MSVVSPEQAFAAGYLPAVTGAWFNLVLLFADAARSPLPGVLDAVRAETARMRATSASVVDTVREAQGLAELAGVTPPAPPRVPEQYFPWVEAIHRDLASAFTGSNQLALFRAGHVLGEVLCSWNLALGVIRLLMADPDAPAFVRQLESCRDDLLRLAAVSAALAVGAGPTEPALIAARRAVEALDWFALHEGDAAGWRALGVQLQEKMGALEHEVNVTRARLRALAPLPEA